MASCHPRQALLLDRSPWFHVRAVYHHWVLARVSNGLHKLVGLQCLLELTGVTLIRANVELAVDLLERHALFVAASHDL